MIGYIYKLTSPNGKIYIGQTIDIERRFKEYRRHKSRKKCKIINSLNRYGWENFKKDILFKGDCTIGFLNNLEIYYIKKYDSVISGLNHQLGGKNGLHSQETKIKMSESAKILCSNKEYTKNRNSHWVGRKHKEESKRKMSIKRKGIPLSDEWRENIIKSLLIKGGKTVLNTSTGIYYKSIKEASLSIPMNYFTFKNKLNGSKFNNTEFIIC